MGVKHLYGCLLGGAIGDAYGLPYEGLSPRRIRRLFKEEQFCLIAIINGAMVSDDTDHAVMTVQAYVKSGGDVDKFTTHLKRQLMGWLLTLPAGIGMATGRSLFKMWLGFTQTGVFSAGNGAAMRAAVLGVLCDELDTLKRLNHASTTLTHTDPKAEQGAYLIALLAWVETHYSDWQNDVVHEFIKRHIDDDELLNLLDTYAPCPKKGITGYMYDTVPAVYQAWQRYRHHPVAGMNALIQSGGDTDSTCAIFGGIVGVRHADDLQNGIRGIWCEPRLAPKFFNALSKQAFSLDKRPACAIKFTVPITLLRNVVFLIIVLVHGFRRLLPPY